jgi:hypothetical protein
MCEADNLAAICDPIVWTMWILNISQTYRLPQFVKGIALLCYVDDIRIPQEIYVWDSQPVKGISLLGASSYFTYNESLILLNLSFIVQRFITTIQI